MAGVIRLGRPIELEQGMSHLVVLSVCLSLSRPSCHTQAGPQGVRFPFLRVEVEGRYYVVPVTM